MIRNIILSAIASLKRKKMASIFTLLTISLGMTMIVILASLYNSYTGNIGPYKQRSNSLYLSNLKFAKNGKTIQREVYKHSTSSFIDEYLRTLKTPELIGLYGRSMERNLGTSYKPYRVKYLETDANFWKIHNFSFLAGRPFLQQEVDNKEPVCILSKKAADFLFKDSNVIGKHFLRGKEKFRIVGVIQNEHPHFEVSADVYLQYSSSGWDENKIYKNSRTNEDIYYGRGVFKSVLLVGKGTSIKLVKKEFKQLTEKINRQNRFEEFDELKTGLKSPTQLIPGLLFDNNNGALDMVVFIIMLLCFLLVPIIILSNINLYALRDRIEEIGIRKSFGASRKVLVYQLMIENILITIIGGILALFIAFPLNKTLASIIFKSAEVVGMEFNFTFFILLICGAFIFGFVTIVIPAIRISGMLPTIAIHHQVQNSTTGFFFKSRKKWVQVLIHFFLFSVLTISAFFISYILLTSFSGVGYNTKNTIAIILAENGVKEYDHEYNRTRYVGFREKLLQVPEVEQVSYVLENPPSWIVPQKQKYILHDVEIDIRTLETDTCFFQLLEMDALKGKLYDKPTIKETFIPGVATLAAQQKYFGGDAVGKIFIRKQDSKKVKIIGLVEKYKHHPSADYYAGIFTLRNHPSRSVLIKYNPKSNTFDLEEKLRKVISNNFDNVFITHNQNIEVDFNSAIERMKPMFYGVIMGISFLLVNALLGFFTLIWYNVRSRKKELGIRRAVGANKNSIQRKVIAENLLFMLIGSAISAIIFCQFFIIVLPDDRIKHFWLGLAFAFLISLLMTLISAWIPSHSARNIQPVEALADE